ncbi:hypothetical protein KIPB_012204, partial [Kipferlia bialata]|eukprot:g12204.t1
MNEKGGELEREKERVSALEREYKAKQATWGTGIQNVQSPPYDMSLATPQPYQSPSRDRRSRPRNID